MSSPVLLVGQAPSRIMKPGDPPFWKTSALTRLASYCHVQPREALYGLFDFVNLVEEYPGPADEGSKYDAFPKDTSADVMRVLDLILKNRYDRVVLLGRHVDVAFQKQAVTTSEPWFRWTPPRYGARWEVARSPHPGGTSTYWNEKVARQAGMEFWSDLVRWRCERFAGFPEWLSSLYRSAQAVGEPAVGGSRQAPLPVVQRGLNVLPSVDIKPWQVPPSGFTPV